MKLIKVIILLFFSLLATYASDEDLASFDKVWSTVNEKHWDLAATGVDWQKVYETYKPRVLAAKNRSECRQLLSQMLAELGQSHFQIMESKSGTKVEDLRRLYGGNATPGFKVALVENRVFIVQIAEGSDASRLNMGIGTEILKIDNKPLEPIVKEILEAYEGEPNSAVHIPDTLNSVFAGGLSQRITLLLQEGDVTRQVTIPLTAPEGEYKNLMSLNGLFFVYESKVLPGNVGYVHFNIFLPDAGQRFKEDMDTIFKDTNGLIIDVRGNPGGMGIMAVTIVNRMFSEKGLRLGSMVNSGGKMNFPIFPQKPLYDKPVAILVDQSSASTSEILAGGMQDLGRARIFGVTTAGAALPSVITDLPNGDRFQYAIANYVTYNGRHLESIGMVPDQLTPHTLASMARKQDASLSAACEWIKKSPNGVK